VANDLTGFSITEVNANNGALIRVIRQPRVDLRMQSAPVTNGTDIWIISSAGPSTGRISEFNASTGALVRIIQQGLASPEGIGADTGHVWVSDVSSHTVTELNASTGAVIRQVPEPHFFAAQEVVSNGTDVWVISDEGTGTKFTVMEFPVA
jgi:outer membrane protein assembly factor BamB